LRHPRQAEEIDIKLAAPLGRLHLLEGAIGSVAGVVDQHVNPAVGREDFPDGGLQ